MKLHESLAIMKITDTEFVNHDVFTLKKQYHKIALKVHPDKGGTEIEFQRLNEAYTCLNEIKLTYVKESTIKDGDAFKYVELLMFLLHNEHLRSFVYGKCMTIVQNLLQELKMKCYQSFVNKQVESTDEIIVELKPTLHDMVVNNVYKYNYEDTYFLVPLWHGEVHFGHKGKSVVFLCNPIIPDNLYIDKYNIVHIICKCKFTEIIKQTVLHVSFGNDEFEIPVEKLRITDYQTYKFYKKGLSEINIHDSYDVSNKMDIVVHIYLS